ncbi:hypothetical protein PFICI_04103 [Pestalotiopsis fici W106-1]|uniref:Heterokaryon incompatibility domain-containing protein n=1 Tax=Pestalotiopsis fici (strain W106-1 / CGMCC3.15140) TaxID=1229662 RepID=W3XJ35_PESFW|nr:uncharacterized protein PFICI_04103 [Pestalotiopsis fici W106-1]ETS86078.1 hypothetical protein PFICI_04103 [Pestalotiopsis fici W106-1]
MDHDKLKNDYFFAQKHGGWRKGMYGRWKEILENGYDANEEWNNNSKRASPLFSVVLDNELELAELLLAHGASTEKPHSAGRTPLQEAVVLSSAAMVQLLLDRGAKVDAPIRSGLLVGGTALHLAVMEGRMEIVRTLLAHKADPRAQTEAGWTPVDIAMLDHQVVMLEALSKDNDLLSILDRDQPGKENGGFSNRATIAFHLLENSVRHTDRSHASFYQGCLSAILSELRHYQKEISNLAMILCREMNAALKAEAGVNGDIVWPRKLCDACGRFDVQDYHDALKIFEHSPNFSALMQSSNNGCNLCQLLVGALGEKWCLLHQIDKKWLKEFGKDPRVRVRLDPRRNVKTKDGEYQLIVVCDEKIAFLDLNHVQKQLNHAVAESQPYDTQGSGSDRSLAMAQAWMQRCEDEHSSCRRAEHGMLPTRVIDVGSNDTPPRIYVSNRERVPYAVLSYCWGANQNILLLTTNVNAYTECIPVESLPRTIADAVIITRKMKLRYLWVDALCILQNSEEDLAHELSYMGDIYANALFTIAAKDSNASTDGCFRERNWPASALVPLNIRLPTKTTQRESDILGQIVNTRTSCLNRLMIVSRWRGSGDRNVPVLETRGWTLQEELLSRRVLNFEKGGLSWTCLEGMCSEGSPEQADVRSWHKWQYAIKRVIVTGFEGYGSLNRVEETELFNYWLEVVENYLSRKLTKPGDKIAAIAGVQAAIGRHLKDMPIAGMWRDQFFAPSLLWRVTNKHKYEYLYSFPCPSWSWASASRSVIYTPIPLHPRDPNKPWVWWNEWTHSPSVVDWNITENGLSSIDGHVAVRCRLIREDDMECEKHFVDDFYNNPPRSQVKAEAIHFETHHDFVGAAAINDTYLMLVHTAQLCEGETAFGSRKHDIKTHLLRLQKISEDEMDFKRIGMVITRSWANKWLEKADEETIRLF